MSDVINSAVKALNEKMSAGGFEGSAKFVIEGEGAIVVDQDGARAEDADTDVTLTADAMVKELRDDNKTLHGRLLEVKEAAEEAGDNATSGVVDDWIDECEERVWFLNQTSK